MKQIYYGGDIITMTDNNIEAIYVEDGIIKNIGNEDEILKYKDNNTKLINLEGKTLMPSFIDPHSHITALAQTLLLIPLSACKSIDEILKALKDYKVNNNISDDKWIVGFGYDHNFLKEQRHPLKFDLDKLNIKNPILVAHVSGHMGVLNSKGLELLGIDNNIIDPEGGKYGRTNGEVNGYIEESAFINRVGEIASPSKEDLISCLKKAQSIYLKNGITTVQDGLTKLANFQMLKMVSDSNDLKLDTICYADVFEKENLFEKFSSYDNKYCNNLKIGGYKIVLDGSPQGKTAWISKPYENDTYCGKATYSDEFVENTMTKALKENRQILAHANGDMASDQMIRCITSAKAKYPNDVRPVMIHAQTVRHDQLDEMKKLGIIPSFFVNHIYHWGDIHLKNLGERAYRISPAGYAKSKDMLFTFHQDTPVIMPNMFESIWCAVNRITKSGIILGNDEKIDVYSALKAVTINAAYQYFEEDKKGSIEKDKYADFIVIDKNPLKIEKMDIKDIKVLKTIKRGEVLYEL